MTITYRTTVARANRFRRTWTKTTVETGPTAAEDCRPEAVLSPGACTCQRPEIWTDPCRWASWAVAFPCCRPALGAVALDRRDGGARTSSGSAWSFGAGKPSRGCTWARTVGSGPERSGSQLVSCAFWESPEHKEQSTFVMFRHIKKKNWIMNFWLNQNVLVGPHTMSTCFNASFTSARSQYVGENSPAPKMTPPCIQPNFKVKYQIKK